VVNRSGARRQDLFISTKLRGADHGRRKTRAAVSASLDRLRLDYLDLYLIHWPLPRLGCSPSPGRPCSNSPPKG